MNKKTVLYIKNLNKIYSVNSSKSPNNVHALKNLNLEVKEGEIFGLLGPNGAGKTTFINILSGTVIKTSGEVNVWGFNLDINPRQVRASIGIVPQEVNLDPFFSPRKLLELQAGMYGVKKKDRITDTVLKLVSLEREANSYARSLSGGMKRRLLMAKALVHQPPILFLDEPTAGVDVNLRKNLWDSVKVLNKLGVTIILTTHYLQEAEEMCNRIGILNKGSLVALDSTKNLLNKIQTKKVKFKIDSAFNSDKFINKSLNVIYNNKDEICISYEKNSITMDEIIEIFNKAKVKILDISSDDGDLEDVFTNLTKN
tara:strand:+ start:2535 stop:3473 length:939 start_codon:yes stop_codon:yes gene_type:complete